MLNLPNFKILQVSRDLKGAYIIIIVELPDGSIQIRWDVDEFTYEEIKGITARNYFDSLAKGYYFELLPYINTYSDQVRKVAFESHIRCVQGDRAKRIDFMCSERFAGNLEWIRQEVREVEDLKHVEWKKGDR